MLLARRASAADSHAAADDRARVDAQLGASARGVSRSASARARRALVAFHNHPSGDATPSADDVERHASGWWRRATSIGIDVIDHLILADTHYCSMLGSEGTLMARVLYFDCFSGAAGDMVLGALHRRGPAGRRRCGEALGSLGVGHELRVTRSCARASPRRTCRSSRSARAGTRTRTLTRTSTRTHTTITTITRTTIDHASRTSHGHRSLDEIAHLIGHSALSDAGKARAVGAVSPARGGRSGDSSACRSTEVHLHEVGAARLHHRHRRRRLRARVVRHRRHRLVAAQRRRRHGRDRARHVSRAGAGDAAAAGGRARCTAAASRRSS